MRKNENPEKMFEWKTAQLKKRNWKLIGEK